MFKGYKRATAMSIFIHIIPLLILSTLSKGKVDGNSKDKNQIKVRIIERKSEIKTSPVETKGEIQALPVSIPPSSTIVKEECKEWYGGIGMLVDLDYVITKLYFGYPAESCLRVGDLVLISIDEIKGEPGTDVVVKYHRRSDILYCKLKRVKVCTDNFEIDK